MHRQVRCIRGALSPRPTRQHRTRNILIYSIVNVPVVVHFRPIASTPPLSFFHMNGLVFVFIVTAAAGAVAPGTVAPVVLPFSILAVVSLLQIGPRGCSPDRIIITFSWLCVVVGHGLVCPCDRPRRGDSKAIQYRFLRLHASLSFVVLFSLAASLERTCAAIDGTGCFRLLVACSSFSSSHRGWGGAKRNRFVLSLTLMQNTKLSSFRWRFFLLNTFRRYGARSRALSLAASQSIIVVTKTRRRRKAPPLFLHSLLSLFAKRRWLRASERATI